MAAPTRMIDRLEQRRADYFATSESVRLVTIANPQRSNTFAVVAFLASLIAVRRFFSGGLLAGTAVGVVAAVGGVLIAAALTAATARGVAKSIPLRTTYVVLTDRRVVVIRCWPGGKPGTLAVSFTRDQLAGLSDSKALLTSRLRLDFTDGSVFVGDVHGTLAPDFAAAGNAWLISPPAEPTGDED